MDIPTAASTRKSVLASEIWRGRRVGDSRKTRPLRGRVRRRLTDFLGTKAGRAVAEEYPTLRLRGRASIRQVPEDKIARDGGLTAHPA